MRGSDGGGRVLLKIGPLKVNGGGQGAMRGSDGGGRVLLTVFSILNGLLHPSPSLFFYAFL